jgi:hypothetical protein
VNRTIQQYDAAGGFGRFGEIEVVSRLAIIIKNAKLDCECTLRLNEAVTRFMAFERRRLLRRNLFDARTQRDRIHAFLIFLKELEEIEPAEPDHSVYKEMALLFDDIAKAAQQGADLMRQLAPPPLSA